MKINYIPASDTFSEIGLNFEVCSTSKLNPIRTSNIQLLLQAKYSEDQLTYEIINDVEKTLSDEAWIRLSCLSEKLGIKDLTPLLQMIDRKKLFCLIEKELLSKPESVWVSTSKNILEISHELRFGKTTDNVVENFTDSVGREFVPGTKQAEKALEILRRIDSGEKGRSIRRWEKQIKEGMKGGLTRYQAALPKSNQSGNKTDRINPICKEFLNKFIKDEYPNTKRTGLKKSFAIYKKAARKEHPYISEVSYNTFVKYIKLSDQQKIAYEQGGKRLSNAKANPSDIGDREMQVLLPFEKASMDHCLAKIKLILAKSNGKVYTARPWLSALIDIHTKEILSIWVSFKEPSRKACAIVIRRCVRRHGKLPISIVVDRGADFRSTYFNSLLANYGISTIMRPAAHSRYGSEVERFFGEFKTQWLSMRPGNFSSAFESRSVSSSHSPDAEAVMTIETFLSEMEQFLEWRNETIIGGNSESPGEILKRKSEIFSCVGNKIESDDSFIVATAVEAKNYTVDPVRGIHINDLRYWHSDLKKQANLGKKVEVRIEPENPYRVYANVDNRWVTCFASGEQVFQVVDPITRMAESIRILEGRTIRDLAKDNAEQILVEKISEADESIISMSDTNISKKEKSEKKVSLFSKLKNLQKKKLKITEWED